MSALPHKALTQVSLIQLHSVVLAVPQSDLHTVEVVRDIEPARDARSAGYIQLHGQECPVYRPTDNLVTGGEMTEDHRICAILIADDSLFGLMCREVISVEATQMRTFKLPDCMRTPDTPLLGVGILGTRIVCLPSAPSLHALFTADHRSGDAAVIGKRSHHRGDPLTHTTGAST